MNHRHGALDAWSKRARGFLIIAGSEAKATKVEQSQKWLENMNDRHKDLDA